MKHSEGIIAYQIVQETFDKVLAYLVVSEAFDEKHIDKLGEDIRSALNNEVSVEIKIRDTLKKGSTGKIRSVISKVDANI